MLIVKMAARLYFRPKRNGPMCTEISIQSRISNSCVRESLVMSIQTMEKFRGNKECNYSKKTAWHEYHLRQTWLKN